MTRTRAKLQKNPYDGCPRCGRIINLDKDNYQVCGRPKYGVGFSCGWRSSDPLPDPEVKSP
jgi:hypothetical protein